MATSESQAAALDATVKSERHERFESAAAEHRKTVLDAAARAVDGAQAKVDKYAALLDAAKSDLKGAKDALRQLTKDGD